MSATGHGAEGEVLYEVALQVDAAVEPAYRTWLDGHVREILALPGFVDARVFAIDEPAPAPGRVGLCVQYRLRDGGALTAYLRDHAPRLRADGLARFGGRFTAERRILRLQATYAG